MVNEGIYKHYKGNYYLVLDVGRHSDTLEEFVIYMGLYDNEEFGKNPLWVRAKNVFLEKFEIDGEKKNRFEFVRWMLDPTSFFV
jgi:hypothetical protein